VKRTASAQWHGDLKNGKGTVSTASGVLENSQYSFSTRFENGKGPTRGTPGRGSRRLLYHGTLCPLGEANLVPLSLETICTISLEKGAEGFAVTESHLELRRKCRAPIRPHSIRPWPTPNPAARFPSCTTLRSAFRHTEA